MVISQNVHTFYEHLIDKHIEIDNKNSCLLRPQSKKKKQKPVSTLSYKEHKLINVCNVIDEVSKEL